MRALASTFLVFFLLVDSAAAKGPYGCKPFGLFLKEIHDRGADLQGMLAIETEPVMRGLIRLHTDFATVANAESIGGNAGAGKLAVNIGVDSTTGEILVVGNYQYWPRELRERRRTMTLSDVSLLVNDKNQLHEAVGAAKLSPVAFDTLTDQLVLFFKFVLPYAP